MLFDDRHHTPLIHSPQGSGWVEVIAGPMFSGKTEELIRRLRRAQIAKQNVVIFKPAIDVRYGEDHVISHNRQQIASQRVSSPRDILAASEKADVVGIDEAQFFDETIVSIVRHLAGRGQRVILAGLDRDFRDEPFGSMPRLLCEAEYVTKVLSICMACGNPANYSQRVSEESSQVVLGETDKYEARCRACFKKPESI